MEHFCLHFQSQCDFSYSFWSLTVSWLTKEAFLLLFVCDHDSFMFGSCFQQITKKPNDRTSRWMRWTTARHNNIITSRYLQFNAAHKSACTIFSAYRKHCIQKQKCWVAPYYGCSLSPRREQPRFPVQCIRTRELSIQIYPLDKTRIGKDFP